MFSDDDDDDGGGGGGGGGTKLAQISHRKYERLLG